MGAAAFRRPFSAASYLHRNDPLVEQALTNMDKRSDLPSRRRRYMLGLCTLLLCGLALRLRGLDGSPLWVDEAESSINALTILREGVPLNHYLGMPIYENTLVKPWHESPEYEFEDISYSRNGLALYHGWLPLYSLALAFRIFGIHPDDHGALSPRYNEAQQLYLTRVARLPAVVFGLLSLVGIYLAGAAFHSRNVGLVSALIFTFLARHVTLTQQARYYAATLALSAFCAWSVARMGRRGNWWDFLIGGVLFGLLFHTHMLSFFVMCVIAAAALLPSAVRLPRPTFARIAGFSAILCAFCIPWLFATEFFREKSWIPAAWTLMSFPRDLVVRNVVVSPYGVVLGAGTGMVLISALPFRSHMTTALRRVVGRHRRAFVLLYLWIITAYAAFLFLMPAASFYVARLVLTMMVPVTLFNAFLFCSCAEAISERMTLPLAVALAAVFIVVANFRQPLPSAADGRFAWSDLEAAVQYLRDVGIRPGTRLYATPNEHLVLTLYSGIPVQSIAPVRKDYLDSYPGEIIFLAKTDLSPSPALDPSLLVRRAASQNHELTMADAQRLSCELASFSWRTSMAATVGQMRPPLASIPLFALGAWREHERLIELHDKFGETMAAQLPILRGISIRSILDWWTVFFYRFVSPQWRKAHPNYGDRMRGASVTTLPCANWAVFLSPPRTQVWQEETGF
ncbi:MAG: hypothetical protein JWO48_2159 [Bryobacterales bacterium]|jgi:hypothetical protein|nr:hypothetical protein [Bryobacterales bacterium]